MIYVPLMWFNKSYHMLLRLSRISRKKSSLMNLDQLHLEYKN